MIDMAPNDSGQPMAPSLLDRLMVSRRGRKSVRDLRKFVACDLEDLLNTRCRCIPLPEELVELECSMVHYGLPDVTGIRMSSRNDRIRLQRLLQETIERYESRLSSVRVLLDEDTDPNDRCLHFRIEAVLNVEPAPAPVVFDSELDPSSSLFEVD